VSYGVRPARPEDLPALAAIERSALALFAEAGMPELADERRILMRLTF
jgi:hypothetical protein